jgi:hypothetical protein
MHGCEASSLAAGIGARREKIELYNQHVRMLKSLRLRIKGQDGLRTWRNEVAKLLTKWHDHFKQVTKTRRKFLAQMVLSSRSLMMIASYEE